MYSTREPTRILIFSGQAKEAKALTRDDMSDLEVRAGRFVREASKTRAVITVSEAKRMALQKVWYVGYLFSGVALTLYVDVASMVSRHTS